jgi:hypothetical protein
MDIASKRLFLGVSVHLLAKFERGDTSQSCISTCKKATLSIGYMVHFDRPSGSSGPRIIYVAVL